MPARSMTRADSSISSSGSMVSCITPIRNGTAMALLRGRDALLERLEHLRDLLVHDRLEHALAHRADRPGDLDVCLPRHRGASPVAVGERERRRQVHERAHALPLGAHRRELGLALLELLEVHRHLETAEPARHLDLRRPALLVLDLERLDARHELRHLGGLVDDVPDDLARRSQLFRSRDDHFDVTETFARADSGSWSIDQTRCAGLQLSYTI